MIQELSFLGLSKEMAVFNIKKYGYQSEMDYILNSLGFEYKSKSKIKVSKQVRKQAELFEFMFNINRECYIRLRNKSTGQYRSYSIETLKEPYRLQAILKSHYFSNNIDMMYSLNCYNNMYTATESCLFSLQNIAIDIDFDTDKYTLNKALKLVKSEMGVNIPIATIIETGYRIRLLYTLQDVPVTKKSLKVYALVASAIADKLKELGATPQAPTTFGRIEGSINSKSGAVIKNMIFNPIVYTLRELQNSLLPSWEKEVNRANRNGKIVKLRNAYTLNLDRLHDFEKIQTIREEGYREILCYLYRNYCLLSNMTHEEALSRTLKFNSNFKIPLKDNELDSDTKALNRKQYLHKSVTIIKLFNITMKEEQQLNLTNIMSRKEYNRRDRVYQRNKYQEKLKAEGRKSKQEQLHELRQKIKAMRQQGFKNKDIAQELNQPIKTLERHITYMKKNGLL
ncbi:hypothetical protein FC778_15300 [Clostridium botulinum]|nr:hypothetical protein [Clostridium botulinum]